MSEHVYLVVWDVPNTWEYSIHSKQEVVYLTIFLLSQLQSNTSMLFLPYIHKFLLHPSNSIVCLGISRVADVMSDACLQLKCNW